jgi:mannose-6-phosphate isomerase-like protein (cupin superfamily)
MQIGKQGACANVTWNPCFCKPGAPGWNVPYHGGYHAGYPAYPAYPPHPASPAIFPAQSDYPAQSAYPVQSVYPGQSAYPAHPADSPYPVQGGPHVQGPYGDAWQDGRQRPDLRDYGGNPHVINIDEAAERNTDFRRAIWTGRHLQVVLMSIPPGTDIGLEVHPNVDQFIRIEEGHALVQMGPARDRLTFVRRASDDDAIMIPAGTWHNVTNTGPRPLKLYTIYAPPEHRFGTVHRTKAEAEAAEQGR